MEHAAASGPGLHEVIALINLAIVVAIIFVAGRKGIKIALADRSAAISKNLIDAKLELERTKKEIEKAKQEVAGIETMKTQMLAETRAQGENLSGQLIKEAKQTADRIVNDARAAAQNEVRSASRKLQATLIKRAILESVELVSSEGSDSQELRDRLHSRLVERFVLESSSLKSTAKEGSTSGL